MGTLITRSADIAGQQSILSVILQAELDDDDVCNTSQPLLEHM